MEDWEVVTDPLMLVGKAGVQELEGAQKLDTKSGIGRDAVGQRWATGTGSDEDAAGAEVDGCCGANESLRGQIPHFKMHPYATILCIPGNSAVVTFHGFFHEPVGACYLTVWDKGKS